MHKDKLKSLDIRFYLIPFFILILVFVVFTVLNVNYNIEKSFGNFEEDARSIADSYTQNLLNSNEAHEIISELLNEKLSVASQALILIDDIKNSETLSTLANQFQLDEIHLYNTEGEIIYSKGQKYLGWKAYKGHPVYEFMISDQTQMVEAIRKDSESEVYYKYAYVKSENGYFVQIGVLAEKVNAFLQEFEMQKLIMDIATRSNAIQVSFIDTYGQVVASSTNDRGVLKRQNNMYHAERIMVANMSAFEVSVPVFYSDDMVGTLSIAWPTAEIDEEVKDFVKKSIIELITEIIVIGCILYYAFKKNKSNIKIAYYDGLTCLPNIHYLHEYLEDVLKSTNNSSKAIMLINCTSIKTLKMTYGFDYADQIVNQISLRLNSVLNTTDKLFRFSSDRFIIVSRDFNDRMDLNKSAQKIVECLKSPIENSLENQHVGIEIGIVEIKEASMTVDRVLKDAMLALSYSDAFPISFYEAHMEEDVKRESQIEKALRNIINGIDSDQLSVAYQPKLNLKSNSINGFEALARLEIPGLGPISPIDFIEIAEKKLLIYDLGNIILHRACRFIKLMKENGYDGIKVAVNISAIQLHREEFIKDVVDIIDYYDLNKALIEIEITESAILNNFDATNLKLEALRRMGIVIALDDFGTGFSSLARLRDLHVDIVKIDKFFIDRISSLDEKSFLTSDIISMAHKLGLSVVAEGVETEQQLSYLKRHDCDDIQGYCFSRPLDENNALSMLKEYL